jgi:VIT1/CCC1 family predicted Fe2+/Mn2+ transporter
MRQTRRWRALLDGERNAAALYDRLAAAETGERRAVLSRLAAVERRHAAHWEARLRQAGASVPTRSRDSVRTRLLGRAARWFSVGAVLPLVERAERHDAGRYDTEPDATASMADEERGHADTISALIREPATGPRGRIAGRERWHRGDRSGAVRAAVFGVSDGLVSNAALVLGFAGSGAARSVILLAGVAGLLAGSFSMAAGEYVSMASQREMYERELALEAQELEENPDEEREELVLLYRAKGLDPLQAEQLADRLMADRQVALDTLAREELGLDPDALGSPWSAAASSLIAFAAGAFVVVVPYLFATGTAALATAIALFTAALIVVGASIGALNGRSAVRSAARQLLVGGAAAAVTFAVGHVIGASVV